ncbi:esterase family protein [Dyadobacter sp. CY312]|uniref:alpha/beta hydrolase n=1 Tax=Dyadobacter sp. CY312 TaxID=2907303 RepID=UPI001F291BE2|nr:alpha/beta hydrolase-fold protein [Dyadobacter sp. CY312]MCE7038904.1 esterase family protein [Dyadobacter sp. CY312]
MNSHQQQITSTETKLYSSALSREVTLSIILPANFTKSESYPLLLINDGQDLAAMNYVSILSDLYIENKVSRFVTVGLHASENRIQEYGTAGQADYANRGSLAGATTSFVLDELLPFLNNKYAFQQTNVVYAGFSLGGLMAIDMVWKYPGIFSAAAVFSGALWWRQKALDAGYCDSDRIMHALIRNSDYKPGLKFWFQCGGKDETDDRDGDGIIDSMQDTLECIGELERKGYHWHRDIAYLEMPEGEHNVPTWALAMPSFLTWAFSIEKEKSEKEVLTAIW